MNHQLEEELAPLYALGALSHDEAEAFEKHLADDCESCQKEMQEYEAVIGLLGLGVPPAVPSDRIRGLILDSVEEDGSSDRAQTSDARVESVQSITIRAGEGTWQMTAKGVYVKPLFVDSKRGTVSTLVKMDPGARLPRHRHYGVEECLVLEGDVRAGDQMLEAGDYHCAMEDSIHEQLTTINGALLMIVGPRSYEVLEHIG